MPRVAINYDNTCFYKIVCKDLTIKDLYIGHTTDFATRKKNHKNNCNNNTNAKSNNNYAYKFMRENGGWDNFEMILLEKRKCNDALHAKQLERKYIEDLNATLNQQIPTRTKKEWTSDNQQRVKEYKHQWHIDNIERVKEQHRKDYIKRRDNILEKCRKYYEENTQKVKDKKNKVILCECGCTYTYSNKTRHMRSKAHLNAVERIELED